MRPCALLASALILMTVSAGCASMLTSDVPPENIYWLEPPNPIPRSTDVADPTSIRVKVAAAPGLDTDRLLIRGPGAILNSYAGARWTDNAPEVFDALIRTTLEDSGRFSRVASGRSGRLADWTLDLELRAFFAVLASESSPPTIEIEFRGYLQCAEVAVPIRIANQAPVSRVSLTAIVEGFQSAVDSSLIALLNQLPDTCPGN